MNPLEIISATAMIEPSPIQMLARSRSRRRDIKIRRVKPTAMKT